MRSDRFEEVEGKAVPGQLVGVDESQARVESHDQAGTAAFDLGEAIEVVEHGVDGVDRGEA